MPIALSVMLMVAARHSERSEESPKFEQQPSDIYYDAIAVYLPPRTAIRLSSATRYPNGAERRHPLASAWR
jgi:hypothetical protein